MEINLDEIRKAYNEAQEQKKAAEDKREKARAIEIEREKKYIATVMSRLGVNVPYQEIIPTLSDVTTINRQRWAVGEFRVYRYVPNIRDSYWMIGRGEKFIKVDGFFENDSPIAEGHITAARAEFFELIQDMQPAEPQPAAPAEKPELIKLLETAAYIARCLDTDTRTGGDPFFVFNDLHLTIRNAQLAAERQAEEVAELQAVIEQIEPQIPQNTYVALVPVIPDEIKDGYTIQRAGYVEWIGESGNWVEAFQIPAHDQAPIGVITEIPFGEPDDESTQELELESDEWGEIDESANFYHCPECDSPIVFRHGWLADQDGNERPACKCEDCGYVDLEEVFE